MTDFPKLFEELNLPELEGVVDSKKPALTDDEIYTNSLVVLEEQMPRIHKMVLLSWGYPKDFDNWINSIWLDDRGNRQGFPVEVMRALHHLHSLHIKKFGSSDKHQDIWTENNKLL